MRLGWAPTRSSVGASGASSAAAAARAPPPPRSRSRPGSPPRTTVALARRAPRLRMWASSWATTASISTRLSTSSRPPVTTIALWAGSRPTAKALAVALSTRYSLGTGSPAFWQRPSARLWRRGCRSGSDGLAATRCSASCSPRPGSRLVSSTAAASPTPRPMPGQAVQAPMSSASSMPSSSPSSASTVVTSRTCSSQARRLRCTWSATSRAGGELDAIGMALVVAGSIRAAGRRRPRPRRPCSRPAARPG